MLTYELDNVDIPLYQHLYECIKNDILSGKITKNQKMPSKRTLASNLGVSTITIENAYDQLISEGYMYALPKKGYYAAELQRPQSLAPKMNKELVIDKKRKTDEPVFEFSSSRTESEDFPFSIWSRLVRTTLASKEKELLKVSPCEGVYELRSAIANHLTSFRGMYVDPDQIIVGAGTEYLYALLIKLLGNEKIYAIENPGYKKLSYIYRSNMAECRYVDMDDHGIDIGLLEKSGAEVAHISPTHHFPTGITMPVSRRYELLAWANEKEGRYIIEDDYDSEFRLKGRPVPTLQSIDACEKVIYMNTFSKSLTSTIRISYMVLPEKLANLYFEKLSFYSNTVSTFDQYVLAAFISEGYFEKHINRMRLRYEKKKMRILEMISSIFSEEECKVIDNDSGLHFLLELKTKHSDAQIKEKLQKKRISIGCVSDYYMEEVCDSHLFIVNYSGIKTDGMTDALKELKNAIR